MEVSNHKLSNESFLDDEARMIDRGEDSDPELGNRMKSIAGYGNLGVRILTLTLVTFLFVSEVYPRTWQVLCMSCRGDFVKEDIESGSCYLQA